VSAPAPDHTGMWGDDAPVVTAVAQNVSTRYLAYVIDAVLGLVMLPFNLAHLGMAAYGVWMLTSSITVYFSMLDLGYGGALVRFVAQYRARRDADSLNQVLSTMSVIYTTLGAVSYLIVVVIAFNLDWITRLTAAEAATSRTLLLIIGAHVALRLSFGVYGGIIVGFQRYHLNNITSIATSIAVAIANVLVLLSGRGVISLVLVTTSVRVLALLVYRLNAYRAFPGLRINWRLFRRDRLREVSGFSVVMLALDGAYKLNYSTDVLVIGAMLGAPAVALWSPAQRLTDVALRLSNQLSESLFPIVVDCDEGQRLARLRTILIHGTRLSLATVLPIAGGLALVAHPLLMAWLGPTFRQTAVIVQILAIVVVIRVGSAVATVVLKGAGLHIRLTVLVGIMAVANLACSVLLASRYGLTGVALGTLIPVAAVALFGQVPSACRRTGMGLLEFARDALWPALWPAAVAAAALIASRGLLHSVRPFPAIALQLAIGAVVYVGLFLLAIGKDGRRDYMRQVDGLRGKNSRLKSQVGTVNAS